MVKGPTYYQRGSIEVWDFIRDQQLNYHLGCAVKYICRAGHKESKIKDLKKAIDYLENELQHTEQGTLPTPIDIKDPPRSGKGVPVSLQPMWWGEPTGRTEMFDR